VEERKKVLEFEEKKYQLASRDKWAITAVKGSSSLITRDADNERGS
jgi:hypothetical protein